MTDDTGAKPAGTFSRLMNESKDHAVNPTEEPMKERTNGETNDRPNVRTDARNKRKAGYSTESVYRIVIPQKRQRVRWAFDIFQDQKTAIDTLQFAAVQNGDKKPTVAAIVQQALDGYIRREAKRLPNVTVDIDDDNDNP